MSAAPLSNRTLTYPSRVNVVGVNAGTAETVSAAGLNEVLTVQYRGNNSRIKKTDIPAVIPMFLSALWIVIGPLRL
jgi:hypothetical protein